jgi:hypothetical protein
LIATSVLSNVFTSLSTRKIKWNEGQIIYECFVAIKSKVLNRITKNQLRLPLSERGENINEWGRVRFSTKNSFIFMVNCCTLSTNSVLIKCAKGMGGGGCVGGFFLVTVKVFYSLAPFCRGFYKMHWSMGSWIGGFKQYRQHLMG